MRFLILALCSGILTGPLAAPGAPLPFTETVAAKAFEQERYQESEKELLRLLEQVRTLKLANFLPIEMVSIAPTDYLDVRIKGGKTLWLPRKGLDRVVPTAAAVLQREREAGTTNTFFNFTTGVNVIAR